MSLASWLFNIGVTAAVSVLYRRFRHLQYMINSLGDNQANIATFVGGHGDGRQPPPAGGGAPPQAATASSSGQQQAGGGGDTAYLSLENSATATVDTPLNVTSRSDFEPSASHPTPVTSTPRHSASLSDRLLQFLTPRSRRGASPLSNEQSLPPPIIPRPEGGAEGGQEPGHVDAAETFQKQVAGPRRRLDYNWTLMEMGEMTPAPSPAERSTLSTHDETTMQGTCWLCCWWPHNFLSTRVRGGSYFNSALSEVDLGEGGAVGGGSDADTSRTPMVHAAAAAEDDRRRQVEQEAAEKKKTKKKTKKKKSSPLPGLTMSECFSSSSSSSFSSSHMSASRLMRHGTHVWFSFLLSLVALRSSKKGKKDDDGDQGQVSKK